MGLFTDHKPVKLASHLTEAAMVPVHVALQQAGISVAAPIAARWTTAGWKGVKLKSITKNGELLSCKRWASEFLKAVGGR